MNLIFVYNAQSGAINSLFDIGHKLFSPGSYRCNLCMLTHGVFAQREAWKRFREKSSLNLQFFHRDEFERKYAGTFSYPVVLREADGLEVFISTEELNGFTSPDQLIEAILQRAAPAQGGS